MIKTRIPGFALVFLWPVFLSAAVVTVNNTPEGWVLTVDGAPFLVRGVAYSPTKIGEDPNLATLTDWMMQDVNSNGLIDAPQEAFVDANNNGLKDSNEPVVGDFQLMKQMGVNTIRVYHHASNAPEVQAGYGSTGQELQYNHPPNKELLRTLFSTYGIRVAMGDLLGAYTVGSGAEWAAGTDYTNATQRERMRASVRQMVLDFKDEPFLLMYVLGNENNYQSNTHTNASSVPVEFASFIEEIAQMIHSMDPNHPVAICMGDTGLVSTLATHAPSVDIFGSNVYRGLGFGNFWQTISNVYGKPVLLTEYGDLTPSVAGSELNETRQRDYHRTNWLGIIANSVGSGQRNAIGGIAYSWVDNWWQSGFPSLHNTAAVGENNNEWQGITEQKNSANSPFLRKLRLIYQEYQQLWRPAPTVSWVSPVNGSSLSRSVLLQVDAADSVQVNRVEFFVDGSFLTSDATFPYECLWNSDQSLDGSHTLEARVINDINKSTTANIQVNLSGNIILNPGFESRKLNWTFPTVGQIDSVVKRSGENSARMIRRSFGTSAIFISRRRPVFANETYVANVWSQWNSIQANRAGNGVEVYLKWVNRAGTRSEIAYLIRAGTGTQGMTAFTNSFTAPSWAASVTFALVMRGSKGTVWFDDVVLRQVSGGGRSLKKAEPCIDCDESGSADEDQPDLTLEDISNPPPSTPVDSPATGSPSDDSFYLRDSYGYPNPAVRVKNLTFVLSVGRADQAKISVYNPFGQLQWETPMEGPVIEKNNWIFRFPWSLDGVPSGTYHYIMEAEKNGLPTIRSRGKIAIIK